MDHEHLYLNDPVFRTTVIELLHAVTLQGSIERVSRILANFDKGRGKQIQELQELLTVKVSMTPPQTILIEVEVCKSNRK